MMPMMGAMPMSPAAAPVSHCFYLSLDGLQTVQRHSYFNKMA